ncbi:MAG: hypothetical protein K8S55_10075 [Phycisphaerae bacterium]|nr:hypothetical protein [Phycisphaerae bacterium]
MDGAKVTAEEIKAMLAGDIDVLAEKMAAAMNTAKAGRIIADSEEPVRDAHGQFRQQAYEKAISLLQARQEAFSPSAQRSPQQGKQVGNASDSQRSGDD